MWIGDTDQAIEICNALRTSGLSTTLLPQDQSDMSHELTHQWAASRNRRGRAALAETAWGVVFFILVLAAIGFCVMNAPHIGH